MAKVKILQCFAKEVNLRPATVPFGTKYRNVISYILVRRKMTCHDDVPEATLPKQMEILTNVAAKMPS